MWSRVTDKINNRAVKIRFGLQSSITCKAKKKTEVNSINYMQYKVAFAFNLENVNRVYKNQTEANKQHTRGWKSVKLCYSIQYPGN